MGVNGFDSLLPSMERVKPNVGFSATENFNFFQEHPKPAKTLGKCGVSMGKNLTRRRFSLRTMPHFPRGLFSRDEHAASYSVDRVGFRSGNLADLAVVQPDPLSVGDRVGHRFDEVVEIRFFAMPDW